MKIQQDITKLIGDKFYYKICRGNISIQRRLKSNTGFFSENDFLQKQNYMKWEW